MSTIKANKLEHISTANGGIQLDSSGHVTVDGQQLPTAGPLSNRNLIINGAMQVAQRATSSTSTNYATVDRFQVPSSGGTRTQSQESLTSGSPYDEGFHNFYRVTNTSAGSNNSSDFVVVRTALEDQDIANSGWNYESTSSYITCSFWVRSSVSQEFYAHFNQGTDAYNYAVSIGTLAANTWTKITKTIPGNSNLSFSNDNTAGLEINIVAFWGTNFTTSGSTVDAWYAWNGASRVPDMTTTWNTTASATFDVTGVQLEVGEKATPFEHRSYGDELQRCYRYYYKIDQINGAMFGVAVQYSATKALGLVSFPVPMRANITAIEQSGTASDYGVIGSQTTVNCTAVPSYGGDASNTLLNVNFTVSSGSFSTGEAVLLRSRDNDAFLAFSAEL